MFIVIVHLRPSRYTYYHENETIIGFDDWAGFVANNSG
jgi:hypothetical protein